MDTHELDPLFRFTVVVVSGSLCDERVACRRLPRHDQFASPRARDLFAEKLGRAVQRIEALRAHRERGFARQCRHWCRRNSFREQLCFAGTHPGPFFDSPPKRGFEREPVTRVR